MGRRPSHLPASLGLLLGGLVVVLVPTGTAAAGQICMGVVVDDGGGAAPGVQAAQVAPGTSDLQALSDVGQSPVQNAAGLVCVVGGYPTNGLQDCLSASSGLYFYWSYWEGDPFTNTWTYASVGPASHTVGAGQTYVEGWRYQDPGAASPAATKPAVSPAAAFAQACPGVTPVASGESSGSGGSSAGSGGGAGSGGSAAAAASGATTTTVATATGPGGVATAPEPGGSVSPAAGAVPSGDGKAGASTSPDSAQAQSPGVTAPSATSGSSGSTTTASGAADRPARTVRAALGSVVGHRQAVGVSPVPIIAVSALVVVMAALAWTRWRRRPTEGHSEE